MFNIQITNFKEIQEEQIEYICEDWLPVPRKTVSMIVAEGGIGKSWILLQLALRHLIKNPNEKVFAWLSEDPKGLSKFRANLICSKILGLDSSKIENLYISDSPTFPINFNNIQKVKEQFKEFDVILLDPLIGFYSGDENSNADARIFMQHFTKWAAEENKTILFIHHAAKGTGKSRGASALVDAVRLVYEIEKIEKNDTKRKFTIGKDNYGVKNILDCTEFERVVFPKKPIKIIFEPVENMNIDMPKVI
ncbi:MAG: AAA family ATPase [Aliarcobacter skirrowii]|uniref:AAA family ATPase n=1 Tax=Aliarcobacter skirrowii TaxID=28200 RepID=UPI00242E17F5|nr:AAA family ATPase [Aliarcobacter skirrowii]MDD3497845.1 AAA family ATPase [Aliarcobacter skirrowii]